MFLIKARMQVIFWFIPPWENTENTTRHTLLHYQSELSTITRTRVKRSLEYSRLKAFAAFSGVLMLPF